MGKKERAAKERAAQVVKGVDKKRAPKEKAAKGTRKRQKKAERHPDSEDVGVVAKRKKRFFAVAVGREPGIYSNADDFEKQLTKFPNAKGRRFHTLPEAQRFMKARGKADQTLSAKTRQVITQAAKGGGATDSAGNNILFTTERTGLARGFTLGTVRVGGRSVLPEAAKPVFAPAMNASALLLPQHEALAGLGDAPDDTAQPHAETEGAQECCSDVEADALVVDDSVGEKEEADEEGATEGKVIDVDSSDDDENIEEVEGGDDVQQAEGDVAEAGPAQRKPQGLDDDFIAFSDSEDHAGGSGAAPSETAVGQSAISPHMKAQAPAEAGAVREYDDDELPWYDANIRIESQSARLHNEIVELTSLLQPTDEEDAQRLEAKTLLEDIVREIFPGSSLEIFGSFATGLHLPTSDVDCVITDSTVEPSQAGNALTALGKALRNKEWVKDLEVIARARVPIVKLFVMPWGLKFDISCGVSSGIPAAGYIREQLEQWPPLKPLVTILKLFLLQRNMNEVYTGGLGSFALILSIVAFLKMHTSRLPWRAGVSRAQQLDCNLGLLLIDYFRFFGRQLMVTKIGVAAGGANHASGCYVKTAVFEPSMDRRDRGDRLSVRDPLDDSNDVSRGAFNSTAVRYAFDHAYHMLTHQPSDLAEMTHNQLVAWRGISRLGWILRLDEVLAIRPPPPRKGAKRGRTVHAPHVAPTGRAPAGHQHQPPAASFKSPKKSPPQPLPPPRKHHSSGSGGVDQFFGREEVSRGRVVGVGAQQQYASRDAGGGAARDHHGGYRQCRQSGRGYNRGQRDWDHSSNNMRRYRQQGNFPDPHNF